jgi:hypothetical protein
LIVSCDTAGKKAAKKEGRYLAGSTNYARAAFQYTQRNSGRRQTQQKITRKCRRGNNIVGHRKAARNWNRFRQSENNEWSDGKNDTCHAFAS